MCGLSAYCHLGTPQKDTKYSRLDLEGSLESIRHRGPDSDGTYVSPCGRCGLGHVRLSIIDLEGGHQPISSANGDIQVVVNGELYDHDRLIKELQDKGHVFKTKSDSELALHYYEDYGTDFLHHLRGEFAVIIWDDRKKRMLMARDRFGIKPLYYTTVNGVFMAASEIKAFSALGWRPEWDLESIISGGYAADHRTCFKGVYKLLPAHYMTISASGTMDTKKYWDAEYPDKNIEDKRTLEEMIQGVHDRVIESIRLRLRADVPLGVYLSGGLDSSSVAGVAAKLLRDNNPDAKIDTFCISFRDAGIYDEGDIAERTAAHIGSKFHRLSLTQDDLVDNFERTLWHVEQPVFDLNTVGKFLLSEYVRHEGFKVVMTGEGSDEHFIGYPFFHTDYLREQDRSTPKGFGCIAEEDRKGMLSDHLAGRYKFLRYELPTETKINTKIRFNDSDLPYQIGKLLALPTDFMNSNVVSYHGPADIGSTTLDSIHGDIRLKATTKWHPVHASMYLETRTVFPNVMLTWLGDRVEMAHSMEARTPFLDHPLCEYVNSLPPSVKLCGQDPEGNHLNEKYILKEAMRPYVTDEIYKRTKHPYLAPAEPGAPPIARLLNKWVTKERVDHLGFLNWERCETIKERVITSDDCMAYCDMLKLVSLLILHEQFNVAPVTYL
ncbi:hypothetical protein BG003_006621 [Podila horticola]|nr:hypothetical protein BG003_006621 [Podila horticola]